MKCLRLHTLLCWHTPISIAGTWFAIRLISLCKVENYWIHKLQCSTQTVLFIWSLWFLESIDIDCRWKVFCQYIKIIHMFHTCMYVYCEMYCFFELVTVSPPPFSNHKPLCSTHPICKIVPHYLLNSSKPLWFFIYQRYECLLGVGWVAFDTWYCHACKMGYLPLFGSIFLCLK